MSDWNECRDDRLRKLWAEGKTSRQIGEALGVTRNAVLGRVHRLNLAARPSPIKHRAEYDKYRAPKKPQRLASKPAASPAATINVKPAAQPNGHTVVQPVSKQNGHAVGQVAVAPVVRTPSPYRTCQYLQGEARARNFCGLPTVPGSSWCDAHYERCHQKQKPAESEAA